MRWAIPGVIVAAIAAYFGWAYLTLYQLDETLRRQDDAALERLVDFDEVHLRLEHDLRQIFADTQAEQNIESDSDAVATALLGLFSDLLVGPIADYYASPAGLAYLLNAQIVLDDPGQILDEDFLSEDTWYDHMTAAYPVGLARFQAHVVYPDDDPKRRLDGRPMILVFAFQDFRWQLTRVRLPLDALSGELDE